MRTMTVRLREAADYMAEHGWVQGTEQDNAGHVCLTGAIRYCAPVDGDTYLVREVLRKKGRAENWNDTDGRSQDEVLTLLRTLEVTDEDFADTFGPQWGEIVALVRRAAQVTPDEAKQLAAARDAAGDAAWAAAGAAARAAARDAAGDAAWAAAGDAAWAAAWAAARAAARDAAWDAARALVVRDLIGQHGLTQEHYDRLSGPWRRVVGPLRPDDVDLRVGAVV